MESTLSTSSSGTPCLRVIEVHQTPQITALLAVDHGSVLFEHLVVAASCGLLQGMDGTRIVAVLLALTSCIYDVPILSSVRSVVSSSGSNAWE